MEGKTWVLLLTIIMEGLGSAFFFDTFLGRGKTEKLTVYQYRTLAYLGMTFALTNIGCLIGMWKLPLFILGYVLLGRTIHKAGWGAGFIFLHDQLQHVIFDRFCGVLSDALMGDAGNDRGSERMGMDRISERLLVRCSFSFAQDMERRR